jgi:putative transposase
MRQARIKVAAEKGEAVYHCISRIAGGAHLLDDHAREVLRKQIWQISDFCGVQVITYTILANHFHVLVRVPQRESVSDRELLRRYRVLYPEPTRYQTARLEVIVQQLKQGGAEADAWRLRNLALMNDVSSFMKLLKQRFTLWFNHTHQRYGTIWAERFKSVLIEPQNRTLRTVAAYIDLNAMRAGLVDDPKDYRFCGYAEALAGHARARAGLRSVSGAQSWSASHAAYRELLFGSGSAPRAGAASITRQSLEQVLQDGGRLSLATALRCRWRYFSDGAVLGRRSYVAAHRNQRDPEDQTDPPPLPAVADWGGLTTLHRLRGPAWG